MEFNLLSLLERELSSEVVSKIASFVGEGPATTRATLANAAPAVVCAAYQKASTASGAADLADMLKQGGFDGTTGERPASLAGSAGGLADLARTGAPLLESLFGAHRSGVIDWLANASGIGKSSSASLLGIAVSFVLDLIGRHGGGASGPNATSIANLVRAQGPILASTAPQGLAHAMGVGQCGEAAPVRAYGAAAAAPAAAAAAMSPMAAGGVGVDIWKWLLPVLGILLLNLLFFAWRAYQAGLAPPPAAAVATPAPAPVPAAAPAPSFAPVLVKRIVCAGEEIEVGEDGVESKLLSFLDDVTSVASGEQWFSFDRIEFETDSAVLKPSSLAQLKNIAAIMECYPAVELRIGGYTDSTADDAYNLKLSQDRADNTKAALVELGVAGSRLDAVGYGEQYPIASNESEEGRQRNRRTDVTVTRK